MEHLRTMLEMTYSSFVLIKIFCVDKNIFGKIIFYHSSFSLGLYIFWTVFVNYSHRANIEKTSTGSLASLLH